jgi:hypothetical protein
MGIFKDRQGPPAPRRGAPDDSRRRPGPPPPHVIESAVDAAIRNGEFDNLAGRGKPLPDQYLNGDPDYFAHKLLKDQGFVPEWVELGRTVDTLEDELAAAVAAERWDAVDELLRRRNDAVRRFNAKVPFGWQQRGLVTREHVRDWAARRSQR